MSGTVETRINLQLDNLCSVSSPTRFLSLWSWLRSILRLNTLIQTYSIHHYRYLHSLLPKSASTVWSTSSFSLEDEEPTHQFVLGPNDKLMKNKMQHQKPLIPQRLAFNQ